MEKWKIYSIKIPLEVKTDLESMENDDTISSFESIVSKSLRYMKAGERAISEYTTDILRDTGKDF